MAQKRKNGVTEPERLYGVLREDILSMRLAPGATLDEASIAARFGVSRSPAREAFIRLHADGLVTAEPNRTVTVAAVDLAGFPFYMDALELAQRVTARLAAIHRDDADLRRIWTLQERFEKCRLRRDAPAMIDSNRMFHTAMAEAGRNPYLTAFYARLLDGGRRMLRIYFRSFSDNLPRKFSDEHRRIIRAVERRDPDAAERAAGAHARHVGERFVGMMSVRDAAGVSAKVMSESAPKKRSKKK